MKCIEFWFVFYITNYQIFKRNNDVLVNLIFLNQMLAQSFTFNLGEKAELLENVVFKFTITTPIIHEIV